MTMPEAPVGGVDYSTANGVYCQYCGSTPAVNLDLRAHRGMVFMMQFRKLPGPFCRDCGMAVFRKMTGEGLVQGWWGPASVVINAFTLLMNVVARGRIAALAPPLPGAHSLPMDPGKPLTRRPEFFGIIFPIAIVVFLLIAIGNSDSSNSTRSSGYPSTYPRYTTPYMPVVPAAPFTTTPAVKDGRSAQVGDCIWNKHGSLETDNDPELMVVPCTDARAQAEVIGRPTGFTAEKDCETKFPESDMVFTHSTQYGGGPKIQDFALCLRSK